MMQKYSYKLRICALLLCLSVLLPAVTACNGKNTEKEAVQERVTNVYRSNKIDIPEDISPDIDTISLRDGRIYVRCRRILDRETYTYENIMYSVDENGGDAQIEKLPDNSDDGTSYISEFTTDSEGNTISVISNYDIETQTQSIILRKCDAQSNVLFDIDPKTLVPDTGSDDMMRDFFNVDHLCIDDKDNICISTRNAFIMLDKNGTKLFAIPFENWIDDVISTSDGKIYVKYRDNQYKMKFSTVNVEKKELDAPISLPENIDSNSDIILGKGYDFYIKDDTGVYGYNAGDESPTPLLNWINSDIAGTEVGKLVVIDPDKFVMAGYMNFNLNILTRIPDDEVVPKYLIRLAGLYMDTYRLMPLITNFNQRNEKYRVVIEDYSRYNTNEDYELGRKTLINDLTSGKQPDILSLAGLDSKNLISKGMFVDLYRYLDSPDSRLKRDDLFNCVKGPFEHKGELPVLVSEFSVDTLVGKTANIGDAKGWTTDEFTAFAQNLPEGTKLFRDDSITSSYMLEMLLTADLSSYIDYEKGSCSFDQGSFARLLEFCGGYPAEITEDNSRYELGSEGDVYSEYRDNKIMLSNEYIYDVVTYIKTAFTFGMEPINMIGFPSLGRNGAIIVAKSSYGITKDSAVKDGAWEFLTFITSPDGIFEDAFRGGGMGFRAVKASFRKTAEQETKLYYAFSSNGSWSSSSGPMNNEYEKDSYQLQITQSDVDAVFDYLDSITLSAAIDTTVMDMIREEVDYYFKGTKSADEVAKIIQSRVSFYIAENS